MNESVQNRNMQEHRQRSVRFTMASALTAQAVFHRLDQATLLSQVPLPLP